MKRRDFFNLMLGISGVTAIALYARGGMMGGMGMMSGGMGGMMRRGDSLENLNSFTNRLYIPPEIKGRLINGVRHYSLKMQRGYSQFFKGIKTPTYGVNGSYLGPTIRLKVGSKVSLDWHNSIGEATTMHGHGMHLPATEDGNIHQVIKNGSSWSAKYIVNQKACTNWYHPHMMEKTAEHVLMGLGGFIIIDDKESLRMPLPKSYGVDDIPLVFQDRLFTRDGYFAYPRNMMTVMHGFVGNRLLVNGTIAPFVEVEDSLIRFRLLNGSNSRVYRFSLNGKSIKLIAGDNSFLEKPLTLDSVTLSPAERAEIVIDFSKSFGKKFYLVDLESGVKVLEIRVNKKAKYKKYIPTKLTTLEPIDLNRVKKRRKFVLSVGGPGRLLINGKSMNPNRIDERVKIGEYEIWSVYNEPMGMGMMRMVHNFHMHGSHFRVISRNGSMANVKPWEFGYKDTVMLEPGDRVELLVRHTDYANSKVPYMYHCHILEHEDAGMMGQYLLVGVYNEKSFNRSNSFYNRCICTN